MDTAWDRGDQPIAYKFSQLRALGFDGVSCTGTDVAQIQTTLKAAEAGDLKLRALYVGVPLEKGKPSPPGNMDDVFAAVSGKGTIVWLFMEGRGVQPSDAGADARAVPVLQDLADRAHKHSVKLALYPHTGMWVQTVGDAMRLCKAVNRPNFGLSFNLCHALKMGDEPHVLELLEKAKPYLFVVTVNGADANAANASWDKLIQPIGRGSYDLHPLLKQLRAQGYDGPIGFQGYGIKEAPLVTLHQTIEAWKGLAADAAAAELPPKARLVLNEDWSPEKIDGHRWYMPRKKWGEGNHGVTADNVRIGRDRVNAADKNVLVIEAHGDDYDGSAAGEGGVKTRVGGVVVSKAFFASGRFEVVMKIGSANGGDGQPKDPRKPVGCVPAIWTYAYRSIASEKGKEDHFSPAQPLYNPQMQRFGAGRNEYWSELDFPEFGKDGKFDRPMYNTFLQNRHEPKERPVDGVADGQYHTFITEWRTCLQPMASVLDSQVTEQGGFCWVADKAIPFDSYLGNPLKRIGKDQYAVYAGLRADHWIDGKKVAENGLFVPSMAAQLTIGVWLPKWAGPAPWKTTTISIASAKVWQYDDEGDVRGVLTESLVDQFDRLGEPLP